MLPAFRANSLCWRSKVVKRPRVIPGAFAWAAKVVITNRLSFGSGIAAAEPPRFSVGPAPASPPDDETPPVAPDHGEFIG
jgi:hypothetical protein